MGYEPGNFQHAVYIYIISVPNAPPSWTWQSKFFLSPFRSELNKIMHAHRDIKRIPGPKQLDASAALAPASCQPGTRGIPLWSSVKTQFVSGSRKQKKKKTLPVMSARIYIYIYIYLDQVIVWTLFQFFFLFLVFFFFFFFFFSRIGQSISADHSGLQEGLSGHPHP